MLFIKKGNSADRRPTVQTDPSPGDCPAVPAGLQGRCEVDLTDVTWQEVERELASTDLQHGGQFSPACYTTHRGGQIICRESPDIF